MKRGNLPFQILTAMAKQRIGANAEKCRTVFEFFRVSLALKCTLRRDLADCDLTEVGFSVLVTLFASDPAPSSVANVATQTGATRTAVTEAAHWLEARALIHRAPDRRDRRVTYLHLTEEGRRAAERALKRIVDRANQLSLRITDDQVAPTLGVCRQLDQVLRSIERRSGTKPAAQCCDLG